MSRTTGSLKAELIAQLDNKTATIGIIGLGYVGLPLTLCFTQMGYRVLGFDINPVFVDKVNAGQSYIEHIPSTKIACAVDAGLLTATLDISRISECDAIILCLPTPLNPSREPDLSFVINTLDSLMPFIQAGQVISLESTTYPGTTEEEIVSRVEGRGFTVGEDYFVIYSPEREDPANPDFATSSIPKICGGHTSACSEVGMALYGQAIEQVVKVSSTKAAEMTKLLENIHRAVNIGLVNEMKIVADRMGIDIFEVVDAAATKPFGFTPYYPGPGLGGHCIPVDPFYLTWKAKEYGVHTRFIELSGEVNRAMPKYVVGKLVDALQARGKDIVGAAVLVLGIAYKKNVDDTRESPSVVIMDILREQGAQVAYSDPHIDVFPVMRDYQFDLTSETLSEANIASFDAVIVATDHDKFNYELIKAHAQLLVDTRGKFREDAPHLIKA